MSSRNGKAVSDSIPHIHQPQDGWTNLCNELTGRIHPVKSCDCGDVLVNGVWMSREDAIAKLCSAPSSTTGSHPSHGGGCHRCPLLPRH